MKKLLIAASALSIIVTAGVAQAQGPGRHDDRGPNQQQHQQQQDFGRRDAPKRYKANAYKAPKGYQARQWRKGDKLPSGYRGNAYVVDHRRYGLSAPPRGYQYVRVGNDAVLAAIATGAISAVVVQLFQ